jgi:3-deoxy-manno-octulosonate cytidylyltransferase (CMP-KDO synthetase)
VNTAIVIPARFASSRLPGKPLLRQTGKYLIQHVYERACQAKCAERVLVATDDPRIVAAVQSFGGDVVLTRRDHPSGTDRVAEAARHLHADVIVNLQGDEPGVEPDDLDLLAGLLARDSDAEMATLALPFTSMDEWRDPNRVKVVCDGSGRALYFSRSPIPFVRDEQADFAARPARFLQHLGLYAYRREFLFRLAAEPPAMLEKMEKLEQLRVLAMGCGIQVGIARQASLGVDTLADYEHFVRMVRQGRRLQAA